MTGSRKNRGFIGIHTICLAKDRISGVCGSTECTLGYVIDSDKITIDTEDFGLRLVFNRADITGIVARAEIEKEKERLKNENM